MVKIEHGDNHQWLHDFEALREVFVLLILAFASCFWSLFNILNDLLKSMVDILRSAIVVIIISHWETYIFVF